MQENNDVAVLLTTGRFIRVILRAHSGHDPVALINGTVTGHLKKYERPGEIPTLIKDIKGQFSNLHV